MTIDGRIAGVWRRKAKNGSVLLHAELFGDHKAAARNAIERAAARYFAFLEVEGSLEIASG